MVVKFLLVILDAPKLLHLVPSLIYCSHSAIQYLLLPPCTEQHTACSVSVTRHASTEHSLLSLSLGSPVNKRYRTLKFPVNTGSSLRMKDKDPQLIRAGIVQNFSL